MWLQPHNPIVVARAHIAIRGAVQGVGFRPFVYRLATEIGTPGWVLNSPQGVFIEIEGPKAAIDEFLLRLEREKPGRSFIQSLEYSLLDPVGYSSFEIRESTLAGGRTALVLPDIATCPDCLHELFDPADRRSLYPFTNCTHCGPRFTIIEALPYDRPNTTMKRFMMCNECRQEYEDPADRRFHAQPIACPQCGPQLELWDENGRTLEARHDALQAAVRFIESGGILAVKGLGGFHLMVDATNEHSVLRLRQRKHREEKPFALMAPDLPSVRRLCHVSDLEERLLASPESPIVLLRRNAAPGIPPLTVAASVAPRNPSLGVMLPYTPLHHILMRELKRPVVATSGNVSDEPICTDEHEALRRLHGIADMFLVHDRPIVRHMDDSVARIVLGRELILRRARGYAPLPITIRQAGNLTPRILAVGAHLKNAIALTNENNVFMSQHIGDLETHQSFEAFRQAISSMEALYGVVRPDLVVCDMHPDYLSSKYAQDLGIDTISVQHHYAHVASCMAENELDGHVLGVSWDGTGYGPDGSVWGGEFLLTDAASFQRVGLFRRFLLPGGEQAIKEPRRSAIGLLFELLGEELFNRHDLQPLRSFSAREKAILKQVLLRKLNAPVTSSVGRLFDAVGSLAGVRQWNTFEGQAAMEMEFALDPATDEAYPVYLAENRAPCVVDWGPAFHRVLEDIQHGVPTGVISARFHNMLVDAILAVARIIGEKRIVLTGGCFQNMYLTERAVRRLEAEGFHPYWHQRVPPNDGGIALGQVYAALRARATRR